MIPDGLFTWLSSRRIHEIDERGSKEGKEKNANEVAFGV